jgi:protein AroM
MREKWERWGFDVRIIALSPYTSTRNDWVRSAKEAAATDCDLVVLDCIGYSGAVRSVFRELGGKPVVLPRTLLGRAAAELAGR